MEEIEHFDEEISVERADKESNHPTAKSTVGTIQMVVEASEKEWMPTTEANVEDEAATMNLLMDEMLFSSNFDEEHEKKGHGQILEAIKAICLQNNYGA